MRNKLRIFGVSCVAMLLAVMLVLSAWGQPAPKPSSELPTIKWTLVSYVNKSAPDFIDKFGMTPPWPGALRQYGNQETVLEIARRVAERTNGKFAIRCYAANELYDTMGGVEAVIKGSVPLMMTSGATLVGKTPAGYLSFVAPYAFKDYADGFEFMRQTNFNDSTKRGYAKINLRYVAPIVGASATLVTKKPIVKLEDLKGIKFKALGIQGLIVRALGSVAVNIPTADQQVAIARGLIDGAFYCPMYLKKAGIFDGGAIYIMEPYLSGVNMIDLIANMDAWKTLPVEYQKILEEEAWKIFEFNSLSMAPNADKLALEEGAREYGAKVVPLSANEVKRFKAAIMPIYDEMAKRSPECAEQAAIIKKWAGLK